MRKKENFNIIHALITFIILLLCFGIYTDFGDKYGYRLHRGEEEEIMQISIVIVFITIIVFFITKNMKNPFAKTSMNLNQQIKNTKNRQINNLMETEISEYIKIIKGLGDEELGLALLSSLTLRKHILDSSKVDLMDPIIAIQQKPDIIISLSKKHEEFTAQQKPYLTVPFTIWIHTLRAISYPTLRTLGREMWKELSRGFKHIEEKKENYRMIYGNEPVSDLAGQFPIGLDPSDIENNNDAQIDNLSPHQKEKKLLEYIELHKKGLITKEALSKLQVELLSNKKIS